MRKLKSVGGGVKKVPSSHLHPPPPIPMFFFSGIALSGKRYYHVPIYEVEQSVLLVTK